jgi:DUF1009 family protein
MSKLAVIAGGGRLPALLLEATGAVMVRLAHAPTDCTADQVIHARVERLGDMFDALRAAGVNEVVMAGHMKRPELDPAAFDPFMQAAAPGLMAAFQGGDDALLRHILGLFEDQGFTIRGAAEVLPDLVLSDGMHNAQPSLLMRQDAARGRAVLAALAPADVGQACVVAGGLVMGIETIQGTAAMLGFVAQTRTGLAPAQGGVLVKRSKPGQDLRVDMPAIGVDTVLQAQRAGLTGICLEAGHVMVLDQPDVLTAAQQAGITLWAEA